MRIFILISLFLLSFSGYCALNGNVKETIISYAKAKDKYCALILEQDKEIICLIEDIYDCWYTRKYIKNHSENVEIDIALDAVDMKDIPNDLKEKYPNATFLWSDFE